ncbi:glycoside hydrolase superfamily [Xylariaceae sp. FL0016]|nr:glycoside hydrolase superfamily [Xylariaceae sp. FL0016]
MRFVATSIALLSLLGLSLGQPRRRHAHQHRANRAFIKRDRVTVTEATYPTPTEMPEVVIYVDQNGNPVRTATETVVYVPLSTQDPQLPPASIPEPTMQVPPAGSAPPVAAPETPPSPKEPIPQPISTAEPSTPATTEVSSTSADTPASSSQSTTSSNGGEDRHGVTYSPYKGTGGCKTADEVANDFALIAKDYGVIRLYGVDCDQVASAYKAAKQHGNKLFLGIFDISSVDSAVSTMAAGVNHDWSVVDTVSVGNELVNNGGATVPQSLSALSQVRSGLRAAGYQGPVVVVDTFVAMLAHPELCDQSDYCAANVHPFFDANTESHNAGSFVANTVSDIRSKLVDKNKRIVVTETGWPWQGNANGAAIPGRDHQASALSSIKSAYTDNPANVILFTAFNDMWKKAEAATFMAEQYWGMGGRYSPADA